MGKIKYVNPAEFTYHSLRHGKSKTVPWLYESDGATGASDIWSRAWWVHDILIESRKWDDGTTCSNRQASWVIYDILKHEGRWFRARTWFVATLVYGEVRDYFRPAQNNLK